MTIHEQYHELAEQSLKKGRVDAEAYLVKVISEMVMEKTDRVPESLIDERIDTMQDMFVAYMHDKTLDNLESFLRQSKRILSEVFHDCETQEKRKMCKSVFDEIAKIC